MEKKNALKKKAKPEQTEGTEYGILNPTAQTRRPGMSPEEHEFINKTEDAQVEQPEISNYTGTYNQNDVNSFSKRLAEINGERAQKGEPANLVAPGKEKDYAEPYAKNIADLLNGSVAHYVTVFVID